MDQVRSDVARYIAQLTLSGKGLFTHLMEFGREKHSTLITLECTQHRVLMSTATESKKVEAAKSALELLEEDDEFEVSFQQLKLFTRPCTQICCIGVFLGRSSRELPGRIWSVREKRTICGRMTGKTTTRTMISLSSCAHKLKTEIHPHKRAVFVLL